MGLPPKSMVHKIIYAREAGFAIYLKGTFLLYKNQLSLNGLILLMLLNVRYDTL